jgi:predicted nucleic acid-binding protein
MLRYLLDTNIVIYVLKRRPIEVLAMFNANASRMAISSITLAELMHGAQKPGFNGRTIKPVLVDKYKHFHKMSIWTQLAQTLHSNFFVQRGWSVLASLPSSVWPVRRSSSFCGAVFSSGSVEVSMRRQTAR